MIWELYGGYENDSEKSSLSLSPEVCCVYVDVSGRESAGQTRSVVRASSGHQPGRKATI